MNKILKILILPTLHFQLFIQKLENWQNH